MIRRYSREPMRQIWSDENKFALWLRIEILACEARRIPARDLATIKRKARFDVARIQEIEKTTNHDVIAFLTCVAENVGPASRHIHEGLTSSDIVDTALACQMVQATDLLLADVDELRRVIARRAKEHQFTPIIGRTHGVHAEPTTFGLKLALMYDEFGRARERLVRAREVVRVGKLSGAVGTYAHLSPAVERYVCRKLGLRPATISNQILQRDRHAEYLTALALVGCSVERWATEFRHLQRTEVREAEEFFSEGQKGSSAMPHKRNPITCERLTGLARVLRGNALAAMENVALWHERDISHSSVERVILPDSTTLLDYMLVTLRDVVDRLVVYPDRMRANLELTKGLTYSQAVLLALTRKGLTREEAYRIVQDNAMATWRGDGTFRDLLARDARVKKYLTATELDRLFDPSQHFRHVKRIFQQVGIG
ncbi:MAG: adenylosuccinate lyase [Verrucomicrobiae bacterium]|nr:adenylosuccinate lyase [Verrucomicrobiae bacterium]MDW8342860.1 adenylosuccinate lyase [Verrucomicrobiae bacterium]